MEPGGGFDHEIVFLRCIPLDGGEEARRLCHLLSKMMLKASEKRGWSVEILDEQGWSMRIEGASASLALQEGGLHKFVTRSGKGEKKHTSHCKIEAAHVPRVPIAARIAEADVDFKAQKCGGPGGQHVNKTESAMRALHRPSGISVLCSSERSQAENKRIALQWLQAKLCQASLEERAKERRDQWAGSTRHGGGLTTRSYWIEEDRCLDTRSGAAKASATLSGGCEAGWRIAV